MQTFANFYANFYTSLPRFCDDFYFKPLIIADDLLLQ